MIKTISVLAEQEPISLYADITYKNEDYWYNHTQRPLKMSILMPKRLDKHEGEKHPLLVFLCGGAMQVVDNNVWIPQLIRYAKEGMIVASVEYRTESDEVPKSEAAYDVKAAIRYLRAHADRYLIDKDNVFVMGESAGAWVSEMVGLTMGRPEFEKGDFLNESSGVNGVIDIYGPATWEKWELLHYVTKDAPPFLIFHGEADQVVPISESEKLYARLTENGVPADFYRLTGCIHGADNFYQKEIEDIVLDFIKRNEK